VGKKQDAYERSKRGKEPAQDNLVLLRLWSGIASLANQMQQLQALHVELAARDFLRSSTSAGIICIS
jgi:hypothetical protein